MRFGFACQFAQNGFSQLFAEFHAPLVEAVDAPNDALDEGFVFVHGNQAAHIAGLTLSIRMRLVGRLPEKVLCNQLFDARLIHTLRFEFGADFVGVLPHIKASACAKTLASRISWCPGRLLRFQARQSGRWG